MSTLLSRRLIRTLAALLVLAAAITIGATKSFVPVANAANYCGTPLGGKFNNGTSYTIKVQGNKSGSETTYTVSVAPFKSAIDYGICDADFYIPPVNFYTSPATGVYNKYSAGTSMKIGAGIAGCSNSSAVPGYPIVCTLPAS